jgi:hypothetical protein
MVMAIGRHHEAKYSQEIWKQIESSKTKEGSVLKRNQDNRLNERRMLCDHSRSDDMRKLER